MGHFGRTWLLALLLAVAPSLAEGAPKLPSEHVVQPGQTLGKIAKRYGLSIDELCEANDIRRSARLKPGQRLSLPGDGDHDGDSARESKAQARSATERSMSSVGRGSGTTQRLVNLRASSFSRYLRPPTKRGYVHILGHHGEFKGQLVGKSGKLQPKAVAAVSRILAWPRVDFVMDKRLLQLLAKVSDAFGGRMLRVVSGYRTTSFSSESRHPMGRACDFLIPGVPNSALRDYVRTFSDVGVGYYPNSTFVHLDVRDYAAYWIDYSGPGEAPRRHPRAVAKTDQKESSDSPAAAQATSVAATDAAPKDQKASANAVDEALADAAPRGSAEPKEPSTAAAATTPTATPTGPSPSESDSGAEPL